MPHQWDPKQYEKFAEERYAPFYDLISLVQPMHQPRILDLGCGNGVLTKMVHDKYKAEFSLGIDTSKEMLSKTKELKNPQLEFKREDIVSFADTHCGEKFQLIISNAALQWLPNHKVLFDKLVKLLSREGQLAIQMPANQDYPTHTIAAELSREEPFKNGMNNKGDAIHPLLSMEEYAQLLDKLGFKSPVVRIQLYSHFLESTTSVIEWVKGSLLTYYKSQMAPEMYEEFLKIYQKRLFNRLGWSEPFYFPMKRLFLWGKC